MCYINKQENLSSVTVTLLNHETQASSNILSFNVLYSRIILNEYNFLTQC